MYQQYHIVSPQELYGQQVASPQEFLQQQSQVHNQAVTGNHHNFDHQNINHLPFVPPPNTYSNTVHMMTGTDLSVSSNEKPAGSNHSHHTLMAALSLLKEENYEMHRMIAELRQTRDQRRRENQRLRAQQRYMVHDAYYQNHGYRSSVSYCIENENAMSCLDSVPSQVSSLGCHMWNAGKRHHSQFWMHESGSGQ